MNKTFTVSETLCQLFLITVVCMMSIQARSQQNVYVDGTATGSKNGSNWVNAYTQLGDALKAVAGGTAPVYIHVAKGTYWPTGVQHSTKRDSSFMILRSGIRLYGGYPSGGGTRNATVNKVYLDGDIGTAVTPGDNSYHVMIIAGTNTTGDSTVIDGFTIRNGFGLDATDFQPRYNDVVVAGGFGSGIVAINLSNNQLRISNCIFTSNTAYYGGGLFVDNGSLILENSTLASNAAWGAGGCFVRSGRHVFEKNLFYMNRCDDQGGGLNMASSSYSLQNCEFTNNIANNGGGAYIFESTGETVNCSFSRNNTAGQGGGISGVEMRGPVTNCTFINNWSDRGAGLHVERSNTQVVNCSMSENSANDGGGMYFLDATMEVKNCTVFNNLGRSFGGGIFNKNSTVTVNGGYYTNNQAYTAGGVIFYRDGGVKIDGAHFSYNAAQYGGVLRNELNTSPLHVTNSVFSYNRSTNTGAVMSLANGNDTLINNLFIQNVDNSAVGGGAVCITLGRYLIANNTFYADTSVNGSGGAIRMEGSGGSCSLRNNIFYKCKAATENNVFNLSGMPYTESHNSFSVDPVFVNEAMPLGADNVWGTADDGLVLSKNTTLANTGDTTGFSHLLPLTDLAGNKRVYAGQIDIGAYESPVAFQAFVDSTYGNDANDGQSWATAFKTVARALTYTDPSMNIYVAKGTYYPSGAQAGASIDSAFTILRGNLRMYGGYPAGGGARDVAANPVYLDGNINNDAVNTDNSRHVMVIAGLPANADSVIIDGFTFRNGNAYGPDRKRYNGLEVWHIYAGALIMMENKNGKKIRVLNCSFINNMAYNLGGAVLLARTDAGFENCTFSNNMVQSGGVGGAVYNGINMSSFVNCSFNSNIATRGGAINNDGATITITGSRFESNNSDRGGAIANINNSLVTISNTRFENNSVSIGGGAIYEEGGSTQISGSQFISNSAQYGGAIRNQGNPILSVKNCVFKGNTSTNTGAAMSLSEGSDTLVNNAFVQNKDNSAVGGGALCITTGSFSVINNTFYADTTTAGKGGAIRMEGSTGSVKLRNNIFFKCKGVTGNDVYNDAAMPYTEKNNSFSVDPLFVNETDFEGTDDKWGTADDGLALSVCSPAINSGDNEAIDAANITDISGQLRVRLSKVDMGAYESGRSFSLNEVNPALPADSYCGGEWINYYSNSGEKLLVSIRPGTNDLGTITATGNLRTGYATNSTAVMAAPFGKTANYYPFNRSWSVTTSKTPADSVGVRFYFATADSSDVKNTAAFNTLRDLVLYKVDGANAWNGTATGYTGYTYADKATKTTFTLGTFQGLQYAEFYVTSFSSGTMAVVQSSPLPLDLLSFSGQLIHDKTKLQWLTANEVNTARFDIEHSTGGNDWKQIGIVKAKNTAGDHRYEFLHETPAAGWNYYRLRMVDVDGRYRHSKVIAVRVSGPALLVYPNPGNGQFVVQIDNARSVLLQLFDASGKMVHRQQLVQGMNQVDVKFLSRGVYVLKLEDGVQRYAEKLVITK